MTEFNRERQTMLGRGSWLLLQLSVGVARAWRWLQRQGMHEYEYVSLHRGSNLIRRCCVEVVEVVEAW